MVNTQNSGAASNMFVVFICPSIPCYCELGLLDVLQQLID
jgi:hypothetical protein